MAESKRQLLSIGVFCIIVVVAILLVALQVIPWTQTIPFVLVFFGVAIVALAAVRSGSATKYERGAFSTAVMGVLLMAVGGAWYLFAYNWLYSVALLILLIGGVAIAAALRRK